MKLNKNNYYSYEANQEYVSYSQLKSFAQCEARCMAELRGEYEREETTALLVGSYIDSYFDGEKAFGKFKVDHPEIFKRDGTLKAEYENADEIIKRIERDKFFRSYLRGRRQVIMTGKIFGVPVKIKIDSLHKDKIVDGKVMKDSLDIWSDNECCKVPFWRFYKYDWQAFIYQEIVRQNTGKQLPFYNAVATKEKGVGLHICKYSEDTIRNAGIEVGSIINRLYEAKKYCMNGNDFLLNRCCNCEYCRSTKVLTKDDVEVI